MEPGPRLTATEFFVLVLTSLRESTTMYELELRAGLSSGGVKHVVASLERAGWLLRRPSGLRRSRGLVPTEAGRSLLKTHLPQILAGTEFEEFQGLVRVGWSAMQVEPQQAVFFLKRAADRREQYAEEQITELNRLSSRDAVIRSYKQMLLQCQSERLRCEASILRRIAAQHEEDTHAIAGLNKPAN